MSSITPASTSSIFKVLDKRVVRILKDNTKSTVSATLLYKAGSELTPTIIAKISH